MRRKLKLDGGDDGDGDDCNADVGVEVVSFSCAECRNRRVLAHSVGP